MGIFFKYMWLGAMSVFVAVNLLNPGGTLSQKLPLAIVAGLNPISYFKNQSIANGSEEDDSIRDYLEDYSDVFRKNIKVPNANTSDEKEVANDIKNRYNNRKGDDLDE